MIKKVDDFVMYNNKSILFVNNLKHQMRLSQFEKKKFLFVALTTFYDI